MESLLQEAAKQVPALVVLVFVVSMFLKFIKSRDEQMQNMMKEFHEDHLQARSETREALRELSKSIASCPLKQK